MTDLRDSLAQVQELLGRATPGPWVVDMYNDVTANGEDIARDAGNFGYEENTANIVLIVEAVNFLRTHGPALLAMMEDHSPDAGKMVDDRSAELTTAWMAGVERERDRAAEDSARLDWAEKFMADGHFIYAADGEVGITSADYDCEQDGGLRAFIDAARAGERG